MNQITKYLTTGLASLYLALAPANAIATSGYENKFKDYKPQINTDYFQDNTFPNAILLRPVPLQREPLPLELIMGIPQIEENIVNPTSVKPQFLPINLNKMPNKGKVK